ncbi:hypothetical protein SAMN04488103_10965 [Gemmobacter aquatilis]|uniref:Proteophosphoglycan n=1 Tax=Gemmobacter aquatilis TaxID=933059 RepID=A0A1H8KEP1_9RHOB|nr:DUF1285 domain-containing protein [Gemmobacter aquatilis]SEN91452.1 hypothetical protein SAMN04488103_10965 [Gemmobacter aquatilis]
MIVKPGGENLMEAVQKASKMGPPPVHLWNPPFCGDMDMRIARDGTWFHEGTPIGRLPMVKMFASILKLEEGKYFLVTPVEKVGIVVEDVPFIAVDFSVEGEGDSRVITFTTNVGDTATAGPEHPLRVERDAATGEPAPYVMIRRGLEARIDRKSFYRLVEIGETAPHEGADWFGIRSAGQFFPVIPAGELTG